MLQRTAFFGLAILCLVGCSSSTTKSESSKTENKNAIPEFARDALRNGEKFELISLPGLFKVPAEDFIGKERFHGPPVLGRTFVESKETRNKLIAALEKGVSENDGTKSADCWLPRHGIRAYSEGNAVDFVVCFECLQIKIYSPSGASTEVLTSDSPLAVFDDALRAAGVPLAKAASK